MSDLIYCGRQQYEQCQAELLSVFPNAVFTDASDDIHGGRFKIAVDNVEADEFNIELLKRGYLNISLGLQFMRLSQPDKMLKLIAQIKDGDNE